MIDEIDKTQIGRNVPAPSNKQQQTLNNFSNFDLNKSQSGKNSKAVGFVKS